MGAAVPWYLFAVLRPDGALTDAGSTNLLDGQAARHRGTLKQKTAFVLNFDAYHFSPRRVLPNVRTSCS
jgi:hypothetical protein